MNALTSQLFWLVSTSKSGIQGNISVLDIIENDLKGSTLALVTAIYNTNSIRCVRLDFKRKFVLNQNFLSSKTGISTAIYWGKQQLILPSLIYMLEKKKSKKPQIS